ncbi:MFS transporter [Saccharopolyspora griseoalba]|uniref:MFS transporter n=1 Tax=Saccharopolyspora griseoalba TaxID=1431848 RepID=A0ABW2LNQ0_9PSEU
MTRSRPAETTTRPDRRGIPGMRWAVLSTNVGVLLLNYGDRAALGVAAPLIMAEFGFSQTTMGLIMSAFALTYAPACFLGGALSDRFGPRAVMAGAVAWWSLWTAATAVCFNALTFVVQRLMFGLGEGPQGSVTARTMANWFPKREYATAVGLSFAANPLGAAVGTPVVTVLLVWSGHVWQVPFLVLGGIGLLVAVWWYAVLRDRPEQHPRATDAELEHITSGALARTAVSEDEAPPVRSYLRQPAVLANAFAFFGFSWILFMFLSWYPVFLTQEHGIELESLAWAGALPWIAGAVGTALGGIMSDRVARRTQAPFAVRRWSAVLCLGAGALLCLPVAAVGGTASAVGLLAGALLLLYLSNAQFFALVEDSVHPARLGAVTGFVHFCANLAAIVAPAATGFLVDELGSWPAAFGLAGGLAMAGALALALVRRPSPAAA